MRIDLDTMTGEQFERYRDLCNSRSAAEFRFRRESCGIELSELADDLGIRLDTARRFENPRKGMPPSLRAWAYVDSAYLDLLRSVEAAVETAEDMGEDFDGPVRIAYRRAGMPTRDGETVGRANALARAVGIALVSLGYDVEAEWACDGAAGIAAMAR